MRHTTAGVIGAGRGGRMHAENLVHAVPEARAEEAASPHPDADWARSLGIPVVSFDTDAVLRDPEIEAVVIAAPSGCHRELIRRAAARASLAVGRPVQPEAATAGAAGGTTS